MDWTQIGQDIISNSLSGLIVASIGGVTAWFLYSIGIKGKEREQIASERKKNIYIPLKYEMKAITDAPENIWVRVESGMAAEIAVKNDEYVVDDELLRKCSLLIELIENYNQINLYDVAGDVLCRRFREKYTELYGKVTYTDHYYDEIANKCIDYENDVPDMYSFREIAGVNKNMDKIFKNRDFQEYCDVVGDPGPVELFIGKMFSMAISGKDVYAGVHFEEINDEELTERKITPAEYMVKDFDFFTIFDNESKVKEKEFMLVKIRELAHDIYEDVVVKIRNIGKKYEQE